MARAESIYLISCDNCAEPGTYKNVYYILEQTCVIIMNKNTFDKYKYFKFVICLNALNWQHFDYIFMKV